MWGLSEEELFTYWIDSGGPVNVTDLSGIPPLSAAQRKKLLIFKL